MSTDVSLYYTRLHKTNIGALPIQCNSQKCNKPKIKLGFSVTWTREKSLC